MARQRKGRENIHYRTSSVATSERLLTWWDRIWPRTESESQALPILAPGVVKEENLKKKNPELLYGFRDFLPTALRYKVCRRKISHKTWRRLKRWPSSKIT